MVQNLQHPWQHLSWQGNNQRWIVASVFCLLVYFCHFSWQCSFVCSFPRKKLCWIYNHLSNKIALLRCLQALFFFRPEFPIFINLKEESKFSQKLYPVNVKELVWNENLPLARKRQAYTGLEGSKRVCTPEATKAEMRSRVCLRGRRANRNVCKGGAIGWREGQIN